MGEDVAVLVGFADNTVVHGQAQCDGFGRVLGEGFAAQELGQPFAAHDLGFSALVNRLATPEICFATKFMLSTMLPLSLVDKVGEMLVCF